MSPPLLSFDSYGKSFKGTPVLHAASAWARRGKITVLMGRNGSGKSTLIRAGLGLIRADHGVTLWEGEPVLGPRLDRLARRGVMFLPDHGLLSRRLSLQEQLGFYATAFGGNVEEAAVALDIADCLSLRTGQLSGGEERRAELAMVRLRRPECLVADEPFARVSPLNRERVVAPELRAHAERGAAVLVTGHEVEDLFAVADDVVWMVAGTTHALGTPNEATLNDQFRREYLGPRV